jgi:signal transduction histidine kinase
MTLVKEIIEAMHGSVEIESLAGRGTTVTLWLPAAEPVVDDPVRS